MALELKEKDRLIAILQAKMQTLQMLRLRAEGLMTSLGVFKTYLDTIASSYPLERVWYTTSVIKEIAKKLESGACGSTAKEEECLGLLRSCNMSVEDWKSSYEHLSTGIHIDPWKESYVIIYSRLLPPNLVSVIKGMARSMGLWIREMTEDD